MSNWYKETDDRLITLESGGSIAINYDTLTNKPKVNNVILEGNKSLPDIGIIALTNAELEALLK